MRIEFQGEGRVKGWGSGAGPGLAVKTQAFEIIDRDQKSNKPVCAFPNPPTHNIILKQRWVSIT